MRAKKRKLRDGASPGRPVRADELINRLRRRGWRLTAQRRVVAEIFSGEHVHLTAEKVFESASARLPEISRATVYNTLKELVAIGELIEINLGGGARRYDPKTAQPHHHLVCDVCGRILDVLPEGIARLILPERHGFDLRTVQIVFRGTCSSCTNKPPTAGNSKRDLSRPQGVQSAVSHIDKPA